MTRDLSDLIHAATAERERALGDAPLDAVVARARRAVRGRRARRHSFEAVAAVAVAAALGAGGWWGAHQTTPAPADTPTPHVTTPPPSPATSPAPTTTPTPDPDAGPVVRQAATDDTTVLRRLQRSRTGEVWVDPVPAPDAPALLTTGEGGEVPVPVRVGTRGDATIYAVYQEVFYWDAEVVGLFEVDAAGTRYIACPSPRTEDPCVEPPLAGWFTLAPGVVVDRDTFYDTLGVPAEVDLGGGFVVGTTATTQRLRALDGHTETTVLGDAWILVDDQEQHETVVLAGYGRAGLVEVRATPTLPDLTPTFLAWRFPFGTTLRLATPDVPGSDVNAFVWDDGVDRSLPPEQSWEGRAEAVAPGSPTCSPNMFSVDTALDPADWRAAGRTAEGRRVWVPVEGGNDRSRSVRAWHEEQSWTVDLEVDGGTRTGADVYATTGFGTDAAFLAAHALYATERPGGGWYLGMIPTAGSVVFECA
ncbi:hypothetical protein [Cellulomonas biazotea]|uniref:hypothetical protein n=2 Tax=Cellulomonas biazotea TaxID=1709 RepID=UPI0035ED70D9